MSTPGTGLAHLGLRERKKVMTRQAMLDAAEELFDEHGFDGVTVAQIADAANVSVKTLFTYFDSKEDLLFGGEDAMRDTLVDTVRDRAEGVTPLDSVRDLLKGLAASGDVDKGLEGFHRSVGDVPALQGRLRLTFARFEDALTAVLAEEAGTGTDDPRPRLVAAQLVSLLRVLTSPEMRRHISARPRAQRKADLLARIDEAAALLGGGIGDYGVR